MDCKVEHVSPVLRPLLATRVFAARTAEGTASVDEGGAAPILVAPGFGARSRIAPLVSTMAGTIWAMAASTLLGGGPHKIADPPQAPVVLFAAGLSAAASDSSATSVPPLQTFSPTPRCALR